MQSFNLFARNGNFAMALKEFKPLAEQGHIGAQSNLGTLYSIGKGVPQDYTEAVKWYRLAAEQSYAEAVKWYRLAAEQGHASAQYNLGTLYSKGNGVPQDNALAHMWYNIA
ncbi:MAG: sel1 repeat family protein, partial [Amylibacter sp.]